MQQFKMASNATRQSLGEERYETKGLYGGNLGDSDFNGEWVGLVIVLAVLLAVLFMGCFGIHRLVKFLKKRRSPRAGDIEACLPCCATQQTGNAPQSTGNALQRTGCAPRQSNASPTSSHSDRTTTNSADEEMELEALTKYDSEDSGVKKVSVSMSSTSLSHYTPLATPCEIDANEDEDDQEEFGGPQFTASGQLKC